MREHDQVRQLLLDEIREHGPKVLVELAELFRDIGPSAVRNRCPTSGAIALRLRCPACGCRDKTLMVVPNGDDFLPYFASRVECQAVVERSGRSVVCGHVGELSSFKVREDRPPLVQPPL